MFLAPVRGNPHPPREQVLIEQQDANTFASWGVDYLKYDWCTPWGTLDDQIASFSTMRDALRAAGRPIVYSINPNSAHANTRPAYDWSSVADMWRTTEDITDSWSTGCTGDCFMGVTEILDLQAPLYSWAGPQHWNDPDMLEVGVHGTFTPTENRAYLSMWAMMAAPLIAGNDITSMPAGVRAVLINPDVLAIDQDSAGRQAQRVSDSGETEVWAKTLSDGSAAVALLNRSAATATVSTTEGNGTVNGTRVIVWTCGAGTNQQWAMQDDGTGRGVQSGRCIDVNDAATANNAPLILWTCSAAANQRWTRL